MSQFRPPSQPGWGEQEPNPLNSRVQQPGQSWQEQQYAQWQQPSAYPPQQPIPQPNTGYPPQQAFPQQPGYQQPGFYQTLIPPPLPQAPIPQQQWQQPPMTPMLPQQPPKQPISPRKRGMRRFLLVWAAAFLVIVIVVVVFLNSLHGGSSLTATTPTPQTTQASNQTTPVDQTTPTSQPTTAPQAAKIGDTLTNSTWSVTLNSVKTSQGDSVFVPKSGNIYLVVDVTAQNLSSTSQVLSSEGSFTLQDETGQAYNETFTDIGKPPDALALQPNSKLRGQLVYEVPTSQHNFTFQFQDTNGGTGTWAFSI